MPGAASRRVFTNLPVQYPQSIEYVVVQVTAKDKRQNGRAQTAGRPAADAIRRRHCAALEPGETLPLAALHMEVLLQCAQRHRGRPGVAIRAQREVHAKDEPVFGGVANSGVDRTHQLAKIFLVGNATTAQCIACRLPVLVIDIHQVNVARHVELARPEFAHADHPYLGPRAIGSARRAMQFVQCGLGVVAGEVERKLGQCRHGTRDVLHAGVVVAVEYQQTLQHQLARDTQCGSQIGTLLLKVLTKNGEVGALWQTIRQLR